MSDVLLTVTPGTLFNDASLVDAAKLNLAAKPMVTLQPGAGIGPEHLNLPAVTESIGGAVRGVNYLPRPSMWNQDWESVTGLVAPWSAGILTWTENAKDWFCRPTGASVNYNRVQDSVDTRSLYAAEIVGAVGVTKVEFATWVPACIAAELRGGDVTFSLFLKNMTTDPMYVVPFLQCATEEDISTTVTTSHEADPVELVEGEWQRVTMTLAAGDIAEFRNGGYFGFRTANLNHPLKALRVCQGQLETGLVATEFKRPVLPSLSVKKVGAALPFGPDDKLVGAHVLLQLRGSAELRYLPEPPAAFIDPYLGWNRSGAYPEWKDSGSNKLVFTCTKALQKFKAKVTGTMKVECWGAGGMEDVGLKGGVGGYTWGVFPVAEGTEYCVIVGEGAQAQHLVVPPYGFGGQGSPDGHQWAGGGLSGVFTGSTEVAATDTARALIVAGGGGAGGQTGGGSGLQGGNGNDATMTGGEASMQGHHSTGGLFGLGGGGGGYSGGAASGQQGNGGTGFLHSSKTSGAIEYSVRPSLLVPGAGSPNYQSGIGGGQQPGLVVVTFTPGGALVIASTSPLGAGTHAVAYYQALSATGGLPTFVWTLDSGTLPPGVTLSSAGIISGTPTTAGTYTFVVKVTDAALAAVTKSFTIVIA